MSFKKIYFLKKEIRSIEMQIDELVEITSVSLDGMPHGSGTGSPVERLAEKIINLTNKLTERKIELISEIEKTERFVNSIDDDEMRLICRLRLIECKSFAEIGTELFMDRSTAQKKFKRYFENEEEMK